MIIADAICFSGTSHMNDITFDFIFENISSARLGMTLRHGVPPSKTNKSLQSRNDVHGSAATHMISLGALPMLRLLSERATEQLAPLLVILFITTYVVPQ